MLKKIFSVMLGLIIILGANGAAYLPEQTRQHPVPLSPASPSQWASGPSSPTTISPSLRDLLANKKDQDLVKVGIWLRGNEASVEKAVLAKYQSAKLNGNRPTRSTPSAAWRQIEQELRDAHVAENTRTGEPLRQFITSKGLRPYFSARAAPIVFAEIPKSLVAELAQRRDVDAIYPSLEFYRSMDGVAEFQGAYPVWEEGITGSGVRVGIIEVPELVSVFPLPTFGPSAIDYAHFAIPDADLPLLGNYYNSSKTEPYWHATATAGVISAQLATSGSPVNEAYRGIAPGIPPLLSGNAVTNQDSDIIAASEWATGFGPNLANPPQTLPMSQAAKILNLSFQNPNVDVNGPATPLISE